MLLTCHPGDEWDTDEHKMVRMFNGSYIDPFEMQSPSKNLVNFATGAAASPEVQQDMLNALDKGSELFLENYDQHEENCEDQ